MLLPSSQRTEEERSGGTYRRVTCRLYCLNSISPGVRKSIIYHKFTVHTYQITSGKARHRRAGNGHSSERFGVM